ncbi:rhamnosyltransferase [Acinetobacter rathckeae]|uniref:rhamnosyltransferase n=1 Tax=Acinetobacter rathckeae TaxID=2605272 RepID=UPI0018A27BB4|nr:rhamnosyltransferase [Acinetobacter rathckeae]MBF7688988.1 rhamnosyltransferase [Acinetobacter rathckeae]
MTHNEFNAVIVTFNPNIENLYSLVNCLSNQKVKTVFIVDNGSKNILDLQVFDGAVSSTTKLELILLNGNYGIAKAQNVAIDLALQRNLSYLIFFDQDSAIPEDFINNLMQDYKEIESQGINVGLIGPRFIDSRYNFFYKTIDYSSGHRKKLDVSNITTPMRSTLLISSGSMASLDAIKKVGLMREAYFIDYVDTEWCFRFESLGYENFISSRAVMKHAVGDSIIEFKFFNTPIHSPFRRYFVTRNAFYMFKEAHIPKIVPTRQIFVNLIQQIIILLHSKNKISYIKAFFKGIKDGVQYLVKKG